MLTDGSGHAPHMPTGGQEGPLPTPKGSGSARPHMFSKRLIKIMTIMERFREEATQRGHLPFADALRSCTHEIASGNMECPLGKLVVDESARTGVFMAFKFDDPPARRREAPASEEQGILPDITPMVALEWQSKYNKLWHLLKEDAKLARDTDCLEALEACNDLTKEHRCPVRELIVRSLWHGGKS